MSYLSARDEESMASVTSPAVVSLGGLVPDRHVVSLRPGRGVHGGRSERLLRALAAGRGRLHQGGRLRGTAAAAAGPGAMGVQGGLVEKAL